MPAGIWPELRSLGLGPAAFERAWCSALSSLRQRPGFVTRAILRWLHGEGIETSFIEPVKPWQNGTAESLNVKFRDECLSMEPFRNRFAAKVLIETWRRHYNEDRPHSCLGYRTPKQFKAEQKQFKAEQKQRDESSTTPAILN